jgi:hypothetical protein
MDENGTIPPELSVAAQWHGKYLLLPMEPILGPQVVNGMEMHV